MSYAAASAIRRDVAELVRPRKRLRVSEAARQYVKLRLPGGYAGPLDPDLTPYMIEPMDLLASREYSAVVFVGPAQSGKTAALVDGWMAYMVKCDPSDMTIVQTSQVTARDYSKRRVDRMHRHSDALRLEMSPRGRDDNTYDKHYRAGNILSIGWPSISQLSGRAIKYMALTDYDRMPDDVDGEGDPFSLSRKRTTTYLSSGMTLAESSPGWDVQEPKWQASHPHEAPPVKGILSLFNLGDRRRFYWPCRHCGEYFLQPSGIEGFRWPETRDLLGDYVAAVADEAGVPCPRCGAIHEASDKAAMVAAHRWVPQGCRVENGGLVGEPRKSDIASFWLPGAAVAFQTWASIVRKYLSADMDYELTGSEMSLKTVTNLDLGAPYRPRRLGEERNAADLEARREDVEKRVVPPGVRFLVAAVDIQGNRFVVQVRGYGPGLESWVIDRFNLHWSRRREGDAVAPVDPATRIEDWMLLIDEVIGRDYPIQDHPRYRMRVLVTACDSGGRAGVTGRAYEFWRRVRKRGLARRFLLVKGEDGTRRMPRVHKTFPDSTTRSDRKANARGEIPVYLLSTTQLKDGIDKDLKREEPGPGYIHFPDWLGHDFFEELTSEMRSAKGWELADRKHRNEAFDLLCYDRAAAIVKGAESIDWDNPPGWAREWRENTEVIDTEPQARKELPAGGEGASAAAPPPAHSTSSWL